MKLLAIVVAVAAMAGCATTGVNRNTMPKPAAKIVDITNIEPLNVVAQATDYLTAKIAPTLKDPDSMKLTVSGDLVEVECYTSTTVKDGLKVWATWTGVNAKNVYGGYTGAKPYLIFFVDGVAVSHAYDLLLKPAYRPKGSVLCVGMP